MNGTARPFDKQDLVHKISPHQSFTHGHSKRCFLALPSDRSQGGLESARSIKLPQIGESLTLPLLSRFRIAQAIQARDLVQIGRDAGWGSLYAGFCSAGPLPVRRRRSSIYGRRCRRPLAAYPDTRASSPRMCPVWPCSKWGLPCLSSHLESGGLLHRRFTLTPASRGGLFSVALACGLPRVGVTHHLALRSPDVPRVVRTTRDRPAAPSDPQV